MLYRRKRPARTAVPGPTPLPSIAKESAGVDPYDMAPSPAARSEGSSRRRAPAAGDPYASAELRPRKRSWDDAFIDTWTGEQPRR